MLRAIAICLALLIGPASANYCPSEPPRYERTHWPGQPVAQPESDGIGFPLLVGLLALLAGMLIGATLRTTPTQAAIIAAIDKAFDGRIGEAGSHSRKKFPPALEATRKSVKDAVGKVFTG